LTGNFVIHQVAETEPEAESKRALPALNRIQRLKSLIDPNFVPLVMRHGKGERQIDSLHSFFPVSGFRCRKKKAANTSNSRRSVVLQSYRCQ
jgi:hypothetical protein